MSGVAWGAIATVVTGVLAVGAATFVASRQNEILDRQARLADFSLRNDLFDRRYTVYADVRDFLYHIVTQATYPERDLELKFYQAIGLSRFYFGEAVLNQLQALQRKAANWRLLRHEMDTTFTREGHYGDGNPDKEHALFVSIIEQLENLPDLFGDALSLVSRARTEGR